jgi:large subunit ribosomal protein L22
MEYQATAKYVHTSPRKLRLVTDAVKKLTPTNALVQLDNMPKRAATPLSVVIRSAIANAKAKNADITTLSFDKIEVMGGPSMKRWHAVSRGMAHSFKKRMTHIRVILTDKGESKK